MSELKKVLSYPTILLITINSIMGTGIFFLPAVGAGISGPASIISWLVLSVFSIYIAMCFGELCSMFPTAGGIYEFSKHAYGRFASFLIGWTTLIAGNITIAMLIVGAIQYLLPFNVPHMIIPLSIALIIVFNIIAYRGMKMSATMLITFAFITLGTLLALVVPSFVHFQTSNFQPFFPAGKLAVFLTIFFIAETFFGWESSTFLAGETKDGQKVMPKALITATVLISLITFVFITASIGAVNIADWAVSKAPLTMLAQINYGSMGVTVFTLLVYLAIIGSVAGWVVSAPRLVLSMAQDKLFLSQLSTIHPVYNTPHKAIIFQMILSIIFIILGVGSYLTLLHLLVPMLLVLYTVILASVVVLRFKRPDIKRYYTVPFGKIGPLVVILFFVSLLAAWFHETSGAINILKLGFSFILFAFPIYFLLNMYYNPRTINIVNDALAWFVLITERINLPLAVRREILYLLGDIKDKKVLEFGCSVGTLTMTLADEVGIKGQIYATDFSHRDIAIAQRRLDKKGHKHVFLIHDENHHTRIHPNVPNVDAAISVGVIGYVQDVKKVLNEINDRLPIGGKIMFLDYDKFFDFIPNIAWLSDDDTIQKLFRNSGFNVGVIRKQGFAWQYIYIYGVKEKNV